MQGDITLVILAGGLSKRMGTDKADVMFHGKTFLQTQIEKGKILGVREILVSGYKGKMCSEKIIYDRYPQKGPLGGMEACFRETHTERCLVLSVDMPLIPVEELERLIQASRQSVRPATILRHEENEEPLIGVYNTNLADTMVEEFTERKGSVFAVLNRMGYDIYQSEIGREYFQNVNVSKTLEEIDR